MSPGVMIAWLVDVWDGAMRKGRGQGAEKPCAMGVLSALRLHRSRE